MLLFANSLSSVSSRISAFGLVVFATVFRAMARPFRNIGVAARGSAVEVHASYLLRQAGLDPEKDVTFAATGGVPATLGALRSGRVDFAMAYDPIGWICTITKMCKVLWRADTLRHHVGNGT